MDEPLYDGCGDTLESGELPNALDCGGYELVFLADSAGTSFVGWDKREMFRISGFFSIGTIVGPNQGIFSVQLDPVAPEDVS